MEGIILSWKDSQKHYLALSEIEEKHIPDYGAHKISKTQIKKLEALIYNEQMRYLKSKGIVKTKVGFKQIF